MSKRANVSATRERIQGSPSYEFLIAREARDLFHLDEKLFSTSGEIMFSDSEAIQSLAAEINSRRSAGRVESSGKGKIISPGELNALGLLHEVLHFVIDSYQRNSNPKAFSSLQSFLQANVGNKAVECLQKFVGLFPPTPVYQNKQSPKEYLVGRDADQPRMHTMLKELLLLWIENRNPVYEVISDFIDDADLRRSSAYESVVDNSKTFFETQPKFGPTNEPLLTMLLAPIEAHPGSIVDQLRFIAIEWRDILAGSAFLTRILSAIDYISEEGKYFLMLEQARADKARLPLIRGGKSWERGEREATPVMKFASRELEPENFSTDLTWMPRLVLIAKNIFVWLDQLSTRYSRQFTRLNEIPDEELDLLARRGFTGLWLIGVWKRSAASRKIKKLNGNVEALASAYSLDSYDISPELGGIDAYQNLKLRASRFGIRLASDMVPNHMGIDSTWVINHPDWFLQSDNPPFYNYSFTGPDLSGDDRVGIFIEDGYWTKTDAGVVFKRLDRWTGETKYIYHGNDGTHMPWNDTAQLDFTKPEVREAVIQTILHVARMFSIIRFDAAMVLTKKHYQRLWFPEPGTGGAIPSRSHFSMTKDEFDGAMPTEFWREVVDRVQKEAPDTLLLAEAFWLMEGYFVRTLGMHRVYNSAFMNMLKQEENANYRQVIKNVLEYNPQILKRFVNFQNNPDEDTAVAQFGKDDKYFGVCTMMATMPGLPMFGHGQIEGYTEKYGMEYRRPARNEYPDAQLVSRHEREIFPLLQKRDAFSEVENFLLYDFFIGNGTVNEDVFAYSNRNRSERSLVVYNNRYAFAAGWIKMSTAFRDGNGRLIQKTLADGLDLAAADGDYVIFRDLISGLEHIRSLRNLKRDGLYVELGAYKYSVFMEFRQVHSTTEHPYNELCDILNGRGVFKVEDELMDYKLRGVHAAFSEAVNPGSLKYLLGGLQKSELRAEHAGVFETKIKRIINAAGEYYHSAAFSPVWLKAKVNEYRALLSIPNVLRSVSHVDHFTVIFGDQDDSTLPGWRVLFPWLFLEGIDRALQLSASREFDPVRELRLINIISNLSSEVGVDRRIAEDEAKVISALLRCRLDEKKGVGRLAKAFLVAVQDDSIRKLIDVHSYDGIQWFNRERFEEFASYFVLASAVKVLTQESMSSPNMRWPAEVFEVLQSGFDLIGMGEKCRYQFDSLLALLEEN